MEADLLADVVCAGAARGTVPALVDRFDGDPVACFPTSDALTDIGDDAGELVPDHKGHLLVCQWVRFGRDEKKMGPA